MSFESVIGRVLTNEGGYVNNPDDPGGETNWGISKRSYPNVDIKGLEREDAVKIYRRDFWDLCHCDAMPAVLAFQALDFAVNSGIETAIRKLQAAAGVADDGHWGPITRAAVAGANPAALTFRFLAERGEFWRKLSTWPKFGKGWMGRMVDDLRYAAQDLEGK